MKNLAIIILALLHAFSAILSAADRPNVILILSDDQGFTDYGFMGKQDRQDPEPRPHGLGQPAVHPRLCDAGLLAGSGMPSLLPTPIFPPSGPAKRLFQEPPAKFLAASQKINNPVVIANYCCFCDISFAPPAESCFRFQVIHHSPIKDQREFQMASFSEQH